MIPFRPLSGRNFVLFTSFAFAALQNVTVDDAVLTGPVVPQFFPSASAWSTNNCTTCAVQPDPSLAYNGTWHETTFIPANNEAPAIEFNFTGSALYIFFIMANNLSATTTFTNVQFVLDNVVAPIPYTSNISAPTGYQYNVPVYANDSLVSGQHTMAMQPFNTGRDILIAFDYLIYSTDTSSPVSPSTPTTSTSPSSSATSSGAQAQGTSSRQNIGAVVGGTVGGVAVVLLVTASLLCYRRYKRSNGGRPQVGGRAVVEPFIPSREMAPTPLVGATSSTHLMGSPLTKPTSRIGPSTLTLQPSIPPACTTASSSPGAPSGNNNGLHEQVELLRGEVACLRTLQDLNWGTIAPQSEAPPEYSSDRG
ncbi:hypothetical protein J3R83DRAFT_9161 [Lanmaoa asiatica]|nr:hypothetical protein J3R83DRAFT_9161 [Lanmaoa asiatica]